VCEQVPDSNLNTAQGSDLDKGPYLRMSSSGEVAAEDLQPASPANTGKIGLMSSDQHISWTSSAFDGWLFEQKSGTIFGELDFFLVHMNG